MKQRYYNIIENLSEQLDDHQMDQVFEAIAIAVREGAYSESLRERLSATQTNEALLSALTNHNPFPYEN